MLVYDECTFLDILGKIISMHTVSFLLWSITLNVTSVGFSEI